MYIDKITQTPSVYLADLARKLELRGEKVIKLQTGDPVFDTHPLVVEAASHALKSGYTHYSFAQGLPLLRRKIAEELNYEVCSDLSERNILITNGAAQGIFSVFVALLEQFDEVLILEPNWPTVDSAITINGGIPVKINFFLESEIIDNLERKFTPKTKAICFNTPNNPTGKSLGRETLSKVITWAMSKNIYIIADEVYRYLQYGDYNTSLKTINEYSRYIFVDSFSKKYAMTGWRIGYVASSVEVINKVLKASQINLTHVAPFIQLGAFEALSNVEVQRHCESMKYGYDKKRQKVLENLINNIDIKIISEGNLPLMATGFHYQTKKVILISLHFNLNIEFNGYSNNPIELDFDGKSTYHFFDKWY
jgi:aspartate/methionine/tyrosine aminotransferase